MKTEKEIPDKYVNLPKEILAKKKQKNKMQRITQAIQLKINWENGREVHNSKDNR